ncbi:transporter substrate-binding domain-containing protein [Endozoicomonas sp. SM1973]|uniref:Transporter substrate-binding domain-containing protein n=1 Tax=Spartinivicinus marinus TaxID=2994442 RepID=A0A853IN31_9GAMM|nr:transporter substrate-binding domain-containing protein [Spartinivicinus marinus]NYZ69226.1 transporter substrate-binding domain-containing protein [Spartinivicinus marinus]
MKQFIRTPSYVTTALLVVALVCPLHAKTLNVTSGDWRPYIFEHQGTIGFEGTKGLAVDVVEAIFDLMNVSRQYTTYPFTRQQEFLIAGKVDALVGIYRAGLKGPQYPQESLIDTQMCFYSTPDLQWTFSDTNSLSKVRVAVVNGYTYFDADAYLYNSKNSSKVTLISGEETEVVKRRLLLLGANRIDTFPEDIRVLNYHLKKNPVTGKFTGCFQKTGLDIAFSPLLDKKFVEQFNQHLTQFKQTPTYSKIIQQYLKQN